jgi:uncharacterized protein YecE (DUF72 family)
MARLRVGTSGWNYEAWKGSFYPADVAKRRWLEYLSGQLDSVEHNGTFYSMQKPGSYQRWYEQTDADFCFALKGPRYITGQKMLKDVRAPLANFFASGPLELDDKLGPILWQLPASFKYDRQRLEAFLGMLPRDTHEAAALAEQHDEKLKSDPAFGPGSKRRVRHAIEFRHESCFCDECITLLRDHGVALVFSDSPGKWPYYEDVTAGFVYLRLHGSDELYVSNYDEAALDRWAARIETWMAGGEPSDAIKASDRKPPKRNSRDVYVYFDNTDQGHAPYNAQALQSRGRAAR